MVGLFWIAPDSVYLGSPPSTATTAVRLTPHGVEAVNARPHSCTWADIRSLTVQDAPVRDTAQRWITRAFEVLLGPQGLCEMTVSVSTTGGTRADIPVHSAAASAYTPHEVAYSQQLLNQFVDGQASPARLTAWLDTPSLSRQPAAAEREALLQNWTAHA
jgi:hypothetical protein